ncbi:MAG: GGDEF domain-containing protein [Labilithrix sp.]|nr:GGDEF domain-containing protein [Labilithrix sp.]MCW5810287.1 GGDEF domain-containing protein [Labilithrix sp.]
MKPSIPPPSNGTRARHRFAIGGLALALAAALGSPALARAVTTTWSSLPIEASLIAVGFLVALGFLAAGWAIGRRVDRLAEEARRDPVTKVGNRRHWEECLAQEVANAARAQMPLSLLLLDVDNLKTLNDRGGHAAGDTSLAIVGEVLKDTCRSRDIPARFGGDEFAVLLPRTHAVEARVLAERIRGELADRRRGHASPIAELLSVSIGICDLASIEEERAEQLFVCADRALYAAKQAGRDRVEVFAPPPRTSTVISLDAARRARKSRLSTNG